MGPIATMDFILKVSHSVLTLSFTHLIKVQLLHDEVAPLEFSRTPAFPTFLLRIVLKKEIFQSVLLREKNDEIKNGSEAFFRLPA